MILDQLSSRPSAAKNLLKSLRAVYRFGSDRKLVAQDPTAGVRVAVPETDGFRAWTDADIAQFEANWPSGSRARLALYLLLYTGQRRSDVVRMGWQHLLEGNVQVKQKKTGTQLAIPLHPKLAAELAKSPPGNLTFLMTAQGRPFTPVGFSNWFTDCARKAGLPKNSSPHGLRKAAARRLAEAGCSTPQIAAITGHSSLREVERYTKSVNQKRLATDAVVLWGTYEERKLSN
jgi:integrase